MENNSTEISRYQSDPRGLGFYINISANYIYIMNVKNEYKTIATDIKNMLRCSFYNIVKLREREGQRVDLGRSLKGHL